jgi:aspartate/methionine/tyrosine aminotransferase
VPFYTFSKTFAITGLRLGYVAVRDEPLRERIRKVLFYTTTNVASLVQYGGIGGLEGSPDVIEQFRAELQARRDLFYARIAGLGDDILSGTIPRGAFYAFLAVGPTLATLGRAHAEATGVDERSVSWAVARYLIERARIGCVPGVDFGASGEGFVRFCFARDPRELHGALDSLERLIADDTR